jgi:hypothetical protein
MARVFVLFLTFLAVLTVIGSFEGQAEALTVSMYRRRSRNSQKTQNRKLKKAKHLLKKVIKAEKKVLKVYF